MRLLAIVFALTAALLAASAGAQPLPDALRSAGVTQAQWDVVRAQVRVEAQRAQVSEASLLAAAEAASANLAASGRFDPLALQQAIYETLAEQAEQIAELQSRLDALTGDADLGIGGVFAQVRAALDEGRLAEADRLLAEVAARDLAAIQQADAEAERRRLRAGETIASRGQVAFVQADHLSAAAHYARAAEIVPQAARHARAQYATWRGLALYRRSRLFAEVEPLRQSIAAYETALTLWSRTSAPSDWASAQHNLGAALALLGARGESGALEQAVAAYEAALTVRTREADPALWAATQNNLGIALQIIGERGAPSALARAVAAYEAALTVRTREVDPAGWARAQMNLGNVFQRQASRGAPGALERAVAAYEAALTVKTPETDPAGWALTQMNLGIALQRLGERGAPGAMERAVAAYELALTVQSREIDPAAWALTQMNLGNGLRNLGEGGAPGALERAVAAYEAALTVTTREGDTVGWARIQGNLAFAYLALNRTADARAAMQRAESAFEQAGDTVSVVRARIFLAQLPAE